MRRRPSILLPLGLAALLVVACGTLLIAACGKYGPPRRIVEASPPSAAGPGAPTPTAPIGPEGTGILNPTTDDPASPLAPPEEPEEENAP
jgi:hypothetical protein